MMSHVLMKKYVEKIHILRKKNLIRTSGILEHALDKNNFHCMMILLAFSKFVNNIKATVVYTDDGTVW